jgi:hypothetical protein
LPAAGAADELVRSLAPRGVLATVVARDGQTLVGSWVQLRGFASPAEADAARERLVAGGLADAYVMQEAGETLISLGVFRDRDGADRMASAARALGYAPLATDRFRPSVEYWLRATVPPGSGLARGELRLPGASILRVESIACEAAAPVPAPAGADDPALDQAPPPTQSP